MLGGYKSQILRVDGCDGWNPALYLSLEHPTLTGPCLSVSFFCSFGCIFNKHLSLGEIEEERPFGGSFIRSEP